MRWPFLSAKSSERSRPSTRLGRRWWQHALRLVAAGALVLGLLYIFLPWWIPRALVAKRIAQGLGEQLGLPVTVGSFDLSWQEGIRIDDLRIGNAEAFGPGDMVRLGHTRCSFSPMRLLLNKPPRWVEVRDARLQVAIDSDGKVNLAALNPIMGGDPPDRLVVRQAELTVKFPQSDHLLQMDVADMQYASGKLQSFGKLTMSARLAQQGSDAPVTLIARSGSRPDYQTSLDFRFSSLDLEQLRLPLLLPLNLSRLGGVASGQLEVLVNSSGVVDRFTYDMQVKGLDAQPDVGPVLPVIDQAQIRLSASIKPFLDRTTAETEIQLHEFRFRLPGMDLQGNGMMYAAVLSGGWEGLRKLEVTGTLNPATLAALAGGTGASGPSIDGDVGVTLKLSGDEAQSDISVLLDATGAAIRQGENVLKPKQRKLTAELAGRLDRQARRFKAERTEIALGGNRFMGAGAVDSILRVIDQTLAARERAPLSTYLGHLATLDWRGDWDITETASLADLLALPALAEVKLQGSITGDITIKHEKEMVLSVNVLAGPGVRIEAGPFVKPADKKLHVEASARVNVESPALRQFRLWVGVGEAALSLEDADMAFSMTKDGHIAVQGGGRFGVQDLAALSECVPALDRGQARLSGAATGKFSVFLLPTFQRLHVEANGTQMAAAVADVFDKPVGQPADVVADFQADRSLPSAQRSRAMARFDLGAARFQADLTLPEVVGPDAPVACRLQANVKDAAWLLQRWPTAARALAEYQIAGALSASVQADITNTDVSGDLLVDATDLQFRLPSVEGAKPLGSALRLRLAGRLGEDRAEIHRLVADVGKSAFELSGKVRLAKEAQLPPRGKYWPPPGLANAQLSFNGRVALDPTLRAALPALGRQVKDLGLDGVVRYEGTVTGGPEGLNILAKMDGAGLAVARPDSEKPAGTPLTATLDMSIPSDLARVRVRELAIDAPAGQVLADATVPILGNEDPKAHLAVNCFDLARLAETLPGLAQYRLSGRLSADVEAFVHEGVPTARYVSLVAGNVAGKLGRTGFRLDGTARADNVQFKGAGVTVGRVRTDGFEATMGKSHGWLTADVRSIPAAVDGQVELICTSLDVPELGALGGGAASAPAGPLTEAELSDLDARAKEAVEGLKAFCSSLSKLTVHVEVGRLRYFDAAVRASYEARELVTDFEATPRDLRVDARFGFSGGTIAMRQSVDLSAAAPRVQAVRLVRDLVSDESVVAQLAQEFPGNTVYGSFSRTEDLSFSLLDVVKNNIEPRYRPIATGKALTVALNGVVKGRGGPAYMARIFPGLSLTTYSYSRMTAFADYLADGTDENDMIFNGTPNDIYISGSTDASRLAKYEIGVILLGSAASPEFNHAYRGSRIPVLNFKARIVDGKFVDEDVSYPLPTETALKVFIRGNPALQLIMASQRKKDQLTQPVLEPKLQPESPPKTTTAPK